MKGWGNAAHNGGKKKQTKPKRESKGPCEGVLLSHCKSWINTPGSLKGSAAVRVFLGGFNNSRSTWVPFVKPLGAVVFIKGFCGVERGQGEAGVKDCWSNPQQTQGQPEEHLHVAGEWLSKCRPKIHCPEPRDEGGRLVFLLLLMLPGF